MPRRKHEAFSVPVAKNAKARGAIMNSTIPIAGFNRQYFDTRASDVLPKRRFYVKVTDGVRRHIATATHASPFFHIE
jgi:hypothetical protein